MYMQKVKIVGNCEKNLSELSKLYLKVYGRLNGTLVTDGGAAPVKQIKIRVFSVLTCLVECQMSMYQEFIIKMDTKNSYY